VANKVASRVSKMVSRVSKVASKAVNVRTSQAAMSRTRIRTTSSQVHP
jgi:hypothetical protein